MVCALIPAKLNAAPSETRQCIHLDEIAIGSGYAWGHLKFTDADINAVPAYLRFGFDISSVVGMKKCNGTLQLAVEPFCNPVSKLTSGVESGVNVFLRYLHPITPTIKLLSEIGTGPMYLSVSTAEQGKGGFNFLNQLGLGAQIAISDRSAITVGYRFRHLSNAGTSQPNSGINTNAMVLSYSRLF